MSAPPTNRTRHLLVVGLWLGLAYGLAEAIEFSVLALIPGALSWRNGNSTRILWVAPIVYGVVGLASALLISGLARVMERVDWTRIFVFVALVGGAYLGARLQGQIFAPWASLLLALGIGFQLTRIFVRRRDQILAIMHRSLLPLIGLVVVIAIGEVGITAFLEQRALARLPATESRPNILILVADTLRADHLSGYGYQRATTPRIDRFAAEGQLFLDAYSSSSWTLPSHASLLTGRRVHEHQAGREGHPYLDRKFPTLAEVLGEAGYVSGGFVANTFWCGRQTGLDRGFVHYEDFYGKPGDALARTVLGRMMAYEVLPHVGFLDIPGRKSAGDINDHILRWIDSVGDRPFFVFANYMDVHGPYIPPPSYDGHFAGRPLEQRWGSKIDVGALESNVTAGPEVLRGWIDRYDESLLYLDEQVGHLLDELARRGVLDNTIVIFTSDHGESFGEHNLKYHGHSLYQEQIRIPLVVRFPPGISAGKRDPQPVALEQIPRLIAELVGLKDAPFPGRSLRRVAPQEVEEVAVSEVTRRRGIPSIWPTSSGGLRSLQTDQWQLILKDVGAAELYDLKADPAQARNLAGEERFADTLTRLERRLATEVPKTTPPARRD